MPGNLDSNEPSFGDDEHSDKRETIEFKPPGGAECTHWVKFQSLGSAKDRRMSCACL